MGTRTGTPPRPAAAWRPPKRGPPRRVAPRGTSWPGGLALRALHTGGGGGPPIAGLSERRLVASVPEGPDSDVVSVDAWSVFGSCRGGASRRRARGREGSLRA